MLETTECIPINNNGKHYTDCMEFSILRFLHLLFYDHKQIIKNKKSNWLTNKIDNIDDSEIINFINKYPNIYPESSYYLDNKEGTKQREDWAIFVSNRDFMEYYRNDSAELFTNCKNIFLFFNNMFNMNLDLYNLDESLNNIAKYFSTKDKNIRLKIKSINVDEHKTKMKNIYYKLSKKDTDYEEHLSSNDDFIFYNKKTIINIYINNIKYEWHLTEVYLDDDYKNIKNKFITGHSVIYSIDKL